jgi:hypothetical protein
VRDRALASLTCNASFNISADTKSPPGLVANKSYKGCLNVGKQAYHLTIMPKYRLLVLIKTVIQ